MPHGKGAPGAPFLRWVKRRQCRYAKVVVNNTCAMSVLRSLRIVLGALAVLLCAGAAAQSEDDKKCLACHAQEGLTKTFGKDETLSLRVNGEEVAKSIHGPLGCAACHSDVDLAKHPGAGPAYGSVREFSLAKSAVCSRCHDDAAKQYQESVHAARIKAGHALAPTCSGCHGAHSVSPRTAYETCVGCHSAQLEAHRQWLPNTAQHHEAVSCAACHAPASARMVDLRLYDRASRAWVTEKAGEPWFEKLAKSVDANKNGLDAEELQSLLKQIANGGAAQKAFRGRIELRSNVEAHRLSGKVQAIRACGNCHQAGAEPFQNVTVSVAGADGRAVRHEAQRQVLHAPLSIASLPEFYAIGATRSPLLDMLFVLALLSGIAVPVGHLSLRWVIRKYFS